MNLRFFTAVLLLLAQCVVMAGCGGGAGGAAPPAALKDTVAPLVAIGAPVNSATVSGVTTVSANATDDVAVTRVEFYLDGALKSSVTNAPYAFDWDTRSAVRGAHTLSAKAYDAAGNAGVSAVVTVTVPITAAMTTSFSGSSAVGTVTIGGASGAELYGLDVRIAVPAGATISSVTQSGVAVGAFTPVLHTDGITISLASGSGFGSGEVMMINFSNVPVGAQAGDFSISLLSVFGAGGTLIQ